MEAVSQKEKKSKGRGERKCQSFLSREKKSRTRWGEKGTRIREITNGGRFERGCTASKKTKKKVKWEGGGKKKGEMP